MRKDMIPEWKQIVVDDLKAQYDARNKGVPMYSEWEGVPLTDFSSEELILIISLIADKIKR